MNRYRYGPRHNDSTPPPCSVGFVSTRSPACKPAIRFASFSGEADSGCWLTGRFVGRERRSHISSRMGRRAGVGHWVPELAREHVANRSLCCCRNCGRGDVPVVGVQTSAIRAWVRQLVDEGAGVPIIVNVVARLGRPRACDLSGTTWPVWLSMSPDQRAASTMALRNVEAGRPTPLGEVR